MAFHESGSEGSEQNEESAELEHRLLQAFNSFNSEAKNLQASGTLLQAWQPRTCPDGSVYLETKGLPASIHGRGDQLALFRYSSCQYRFSADASNPQQMGAVGRVYHTSEPEMCGDVQAYCSPTYLRCNEAAQCSVHSACFVPVFFGDQNSSPASVVELSLVEKDVPFGAMLGRLHSSLEEVNLHMCDVDVMSMRAGLKTLALEDSPDRDDVGN